VLTAAPDVTSGACVSLCPSADHPTTMDYAQTLKHISDTVFPDAEKIPSVTHKPAALYQAFPPQEARRLVERFEWHDTPRHGSWLDLAECALGAPSSLCLSRRIPDLPTLQTEPAAWVADRNQRQAKTDWRFTIKDARIKLKHLYPIQIG
jgi:hypothetical protein